MTKPTVFISSSNEGLATAWELKRQIEPFAEAIFWSEGAFYPGKTVTESLSEMADLGLRGIRICEEMTRVGLAL